MCPKFYCQSTRNLIFKNLNILPVVFDDAKSVVVVVVVVVVDVVFVDPVVKVVVLMIGVVV